MSSKFPELCRNGALNGITEQPLILFNLWKLLSIGSHLHVHFTFLHLVKSCLVFHIVLLELINQCHYFDGYDISLLIYVVGCGGLIENL